jgi:hypothetical protein
MREYPWQIEEGVRVVGLLRLDVEMNRDLSSLLRLEWIDRLPEALHGRVRRLALRVRQLSLNASERGA